MNSVTHTKSNSASFTGEMKFLWPMLLTGTTILTPTDGLFDTIIGIDY